jgi:hypothetical protein
MPQPQPTLPTTRAFVVQLRVQPTGAPLGWDGRVEYGVSGAGDALPGAGGAVGVQAH